MVDCNCAIHPAYQEERQAHKQNTSDRITIGGRDEPEPFASKRDSSWLGVVLGQSWDIVLCSCKEEREIKWARTGIC